MAEPGVGRGGAAPTLEFQVGVLLVGILPELRGALVSSGSTVGDDLAAMMYTPDINQRFNKLHQLSESTAKKIILNGTGWHSL